MRKLRDFKLWLKRSPSQSAFASVVMNYYPMSEDEILMFMNPLPREKS